MKYLNMQIFFAILFVSISASSAEASIRTYRGKVLRIVDGDTIAFFPDGSAPESTIWKVRMISIDTPETKLPGKGGPFSQGIWGRDAHHHLERIIRVGETVEVENHGMDSRGRVIGRVYKLDSIDVNLEMLKSGWAALYIICDDQSCDEQPDYRLACDIARRRGLGIHNPNRRLPQMPFLFRSQKQGRPLSKFVGNVRTRRYYSPDRYQHIPVCDRTFFITETDARRQGYLPGN
jgi:endonuclease YncB( thermonuclease family)